MKNVNTSAPVATAPAMTLTDLVAMFTAGKLTHEQFLAFLPVSNPWPTGVNEQAKSPAPVAPVRSGKRATRGKTAVVAAPVAPVAPAKTATPQGLNVTVQRNFRDGEISSFLVLGVCAEKLLAAYIASKPKMLTSWKEQKNGAMGYFFGQSHYTKICAILKQAKCVITETDNHYAK